MNDDHISVQSLEIESYDFNRHVLRRIKADYSDSTRWPYIYVICNQKEAYVGESAHLLNRMLHHLRDPRRSELTRVHIISSKNFNKSIVFELESGIIRYLAGDATYTLQNGNNGLTAHNYYQEKHYSGFFPLIWEQLRTKLKLKKLEDINITDFFIYSPYKALNEEQYNSVREILHELTDQSRPIFVQGGAGTGKTVLAAFLVKLLVTDEDALFTASETEPDELQAIRRLKEKFPAPKIAFVVPMGALRDTFKKIFRHVKGLHPSMVIGPSEAAASKEKYDILIVDEAHRLRQRRNLPNYDIFDNRSKALGMGQEKTELDWIIDRSHQQILFYDAGQSVMPADVYKADFDRVLSGAVKLQLHSQMRVKGGNDYMSYIDNLLNNSLGTTPKYSSDQYEFLLSDSIEELLENIRKKNEQGRKSRMMAGYAWRRNKKDKYARVIEIGDTKLPWNSVKKNWVNSPRAKDEVGTIHTVQGTEMEYAGVIFGNEIRYDPATKQITIHPESYHDFLGKKGKLSMEELRKNILNTYHVLLTRGVHGTYVYACDPGLRKYFREHMQVFEAGNDLNEVLPEEIVIIEENTPPEENVPLTIQLPVKEHKQSPYDVPFYDISAAAGNFSDPQKSHSHQWIELPQGTDIKKDYFVCKVVGESMNKKIANGSLCLFKKAVNLKEDDIILVEDLDINDPEFGAGYTVKRFYSQKTLTIRGKEYKTITLKPMSTIKYPDIVLKKDKNRKLEVLGVFVKVLEFEM